MYPEYCNVHMHTHVQTQDNRQAIACSSDTWPLENEDTSNWKSSIILLLENVDLENVDALKNPRKRIEISSSVCLENAKLLTTMN